MKNQIKPTKMDYSFDGLPAYWFHQDPFMTHFVTALSALFPAGEKFFIDAVRHFRHVATDDFEQKNISGFIGQEAFHTLQHESLNDTITKNGFPIDELDKLTWKSLAFVRKITTKKQQLAITVGLEHITAILAKMILEDDNLKNEFHEAARNVWIWHATEEIEHKSVSFDVYTKAGGSYLERVVFMILSTICLFGALFYCQMKLGIKDKSIFNVKKTFKGLMRLYGRKGYITRTIPDYLTFFKPDFHPTDSNDIELMNRWKRELGVVVPD